MCSGAQTERTVLERLLQGLHGQMHRSVCLPGFRPSCPAGGIYHATTRSQHVARKISGGLKNGRLKWTFVCLNRRETERTNDSGERGKSLIMYCVKRTRPQQRLSFVVMRALESTENAQTGTLSGWTAVSHQNVSHFMIQHLETKI